MKTEKWTTILTVAVLLSILPSATWAATSLPHHPGDVTADGFVGTDDLVQVLSKWGTAGPQATWDMGDCAPYNQGVNPGDDFVGSDDYVEVLTYWGTSALPEPATLALLLIGGLAGLRRRR